MNNHRNNRLWLLAGVVPILVTLSLVFSACDGYLAVEGTVYEWIDAPAGANGEVYVDLDAPTDRIIKPVADAYVSLGPIDKSAKSTKTDFTGAFKMSRMIGPKWQKTMAFLVEKEGYHTIKGKFQRQRVNHSLTIFLVRIEP